MAQDEAYGNVAADEAPPIKPQILYRIGESAKVCGKKRHCVCMCVCAD